MEMEGELYSIDCETQFYRNPELSVGYCALEKYSELLNKKWHLLAGQAPQVLWIQSMRNLIFA